MFIVFEGHDGVGKTTQLAKLAQYFRDQGREVTTVRTPGSTPISEVCRSLANKNIHGDIATPAVRNLLMTAARIQTWETVVKPALAKGHIVLADRWVWSGYLYQVVGEGSDYAEWKMLNRVLLDKEAMPDLTLVLAVDEVERLLRKKKLNEATTDLDLMEQQGEEFDTRISNAIMQCSELAILSNRIALVKQSNDTTIEMVFQDILSHITYLETLT